MLMVSPFTDRATPRLTAGVDRRNVILPLRRRALGTILLIGRRRRAKTKR